MELKQIRCFEEVCLHRSFSKAAAAMFMTQQGVSKQIANLEKELGAVLFARRSRGVELTEAGAFFHGQAEAILQAQARISEHFSGAGEALYTLRVGVSHGLEAFFDEAFFHGFSAENKGLSVKVSTLWNPLTDDSIRNGSIDAGFTLAPVRSPDLHPETVRRVPLWCIVNVRNPLAGKASLSLDELLDCKVAITDENFNSYYGFSELCARRGKTPEVVKTFDLLSIYDCVERRPDTVGFTLESYRSAISFPNVRYLPVSDPEAHLDICLAWRKDNKNKAVKALSEYAKARA